MKKLILATGLFLIAGCTAIEPRVDEPAPTEYRLYYLGGQSNMEGFGYNKELPDDLAVTSPDVRIFTGQIALDDEPCVFAVNVVLTEHDEERKRGLGKNRVEIVGWQ